MPERYDDHEYWNDWQCEDDHADYLEDEYQRRTRDTAWYLLSFDPPEPPPARGIIGLWLILIQCTLQ